MFDFADTAVLPSRAVPARSHRWILLIHQIPPRPAYLRVKVGRALARIGAVAIKNSVYALPASDAASEAFAWVRREIVGAGGEATVVEASFVAGLADRDVESLFRAEREADYRTIAVDASRLRANDDAGLERLRRRLVEVEAIDFFGGHGREAARRALSSVEKRRAPVEETASGRLKARDFQGRTWVTREHVGVDRMASAWLIKRAIDPRARFRFVEKEAAPRPAELRFDMFDGAFTHEGDRCTFEVLLRRFGLSDPALREIGEVVHALDLEDGKFTRPDAAGIGRVVSAIAAAHPSDPARLDRAFSLFDDLRTLYDKKRKK
jgi:hypothetical protein